MASTSRIRSSSSAGCFLNFCTVSSSFLLFQISRGVIFLVECAWVIPSRRSISQGKNDSPVHCLQKEGRERERSSALCGGETREQTIAVDLAQWLVVVGENH